MTRTPRPPRAEPVSRAVIPGRWGCQVAVLAAALSFWGCSNPPSAAPTVPSPSAGPVRSGMRPSVPVPPAPSPDRLPGLPPLPATATQRIGGIDYTDARVFFARYGLKATELQSGHRLRVQDGANVIELDADQHDALVNGLIVFLGEPVVMRGSALFISKIDAEHLFAPLVQPGRFAAFTPPVHTIVLDAGHGGIDPGAQNAALNVNEKTCALDVVLRLRTLLEARGFKVVLTRTSDHELSTDKPTDLSMRAELAGRVGADLFISVHFNAAPPAVHGTETFIMTPQSQASTQAEKDKAMIPTAYPGNRVDPLNAVLGYAIHRRLTSELGSMDRGLKHARFEVLRLENCPSVLIESGYISSDTEGRKIATPAYRQKIAEGIASGVAAYLAQLAGTRK